MLTEAKCFPSVFSHIYLLSIWVLQSIYSLTRTGLFPTKWCFNFECYKINLQKQFSILPDKNCSIRQEKLRPIKFLQDFLCVNSIEKGIAPRMEIIERTFLKSVLFKRESFWNTWGDIWLLGFQLFENCLITLRFSSLEILTSKFF